MTTVCSSVYQVGAARMIALAIALAALSGILSAHSA